MPHSSQPSPHSHLAHGPVVQLYEQTPGSTKSFLQAPTAACSGGSGVGMEKEGNQQRSSREGFLLFQIQQREHKNARVFLA